MKTTFSFFIFLLLVNQNFAQKDYRALLNIRGGTSEFCISRDSTFWIATKTGDTYYSDGFEKPWHCGNFSSSESEPVSGRLFERASFFNHDTGYISGFIQKSGTQDFIYWTKDGGKNWEEVKFGNSSWIDANYIDYYGNAWMSGSSQLIYFSHDFGRTWTAFDKIEPTTNMRISSIYFIDSDRGIVGDFWNRIYVTNNNCQTWQKIPSPLDQKKYKNLYKGSRPTILKAERFGGYLIVNQQNHIFYTKEDTIEWKKLNNVIDFDYDKKTKQVFIVTSDLKVGILDANIKPIWYSNDKINTAPVCVRAVNGSVYAWNRYELFKVNRKEFRLTPIYTNDHPIQKPPVTAKATYKVWGVSGNEIFQSEDFGKTWYRLSFLPFYLGNFKPITDYEAIISDGEFSRFYLLNVTNDSVKTSPYQIVHPLDHFLESPIKEFYFEEGSQGCFHFQRERIPYETMHDTAFVTKYSEKVNGKEVEKKKFKNVLSLQEITLLLKSLNSNPDQFLQLNQVIFSPTTKDKYIKEIEKIAKVYSNSDSPEFKIGSRSFSLPYQSVDFNFYKNQYDSIERLNDTVLRTILSQRDGGWSTTSNWVKISFTNKAGNEIIISNSDLSPNAWYLPWVITIDGLSFPVSSIEITRFIKKGTPEGFITSESDMNVQAIFQVIDYLYRQKIKN
jgi:hypothetical protein